MGSHERTKAWALDSVNRPWVQDAPQTSPNGSIQEISERRANTHASTARSHSDSSTAASRQSDLSSNAELGKTPASTAPASTAPSIGPESTNGPSDDDYDDHDDDDDVYQCEFGFLGCGIKFPAARYAEWVDHTISHFPGASLPPRATCIYCDSASGQFCDNADVERNWRNRMEHIREHLANPEGPLVARPDYWVIRHLWRAGIMDLQDYEDAKAASERPICKGLCKPDYQLPEARTRKEKQSHINHDLEKERRLLRREQQKVKGRAHRY